MTATTNSHVLGEMLDPVASSLNEDAARKLMRLKANRRVAARVATLARKCNEGELSPKERAEYETYVLAGELVALLQAKARILLAERGRRK